MEDEILVFTNEDVVFTGENKDKVSDPSQSE